jgi:hypothetical protein
MPEAIDPSWLIDVTRMIKIDKENITAPVRLELTTFRCSV